MKNRKRDYRNYIGAFILPVLLLTIVYILMGITPFGEKSLLTIDLNGQYISYFSYLKRSILGQDSLVYSFSKTMSGEMIGLTAYYLLSPFNLMFLLFELEQFPLAVTLITLLKTGAAGSSMYYHVSKRNITNLTTIILSASYALSGYMIVYQQNIMWLDAVILLPIIVTGINKILDNQQKFIYPLFLALALISNYYIGYMICIFSVLYFMASMLEQIINKRREKGFFVSSLKTIMHFALGSLLAGGLAAFLLIPTYLSLEGGKAEFDFNVLLNTDSNFSFIDILSKLMIGAFSYREVQTGFPNVFVSYLVAITAMLFLFNRKIKFGSKLKYTFLLLGVFFSFKTIGINLLWHGVNEPVWFPYRYSFIFSFILIMMAAHQLEKFNINKLQAIGIAILSVLTVLLVRNNNYEFMSDKRLAASLLYMLMWLVLIALFKNTKNKKVILSLCLAIFSSELVLNSYLTLKQNEYVLNMSFAGFVRDTLPVVNKYRPKENEFYRVEKNYHYAQNDPLLFGYPGLSHYSSSEKTRAKNFLGKLGYRNNGNWARYSYGSSMISDSLMGVKYLFSENPISYYEYVEKIGEIYVYENPYQFPLGFTYDSSNSVEFDHNNTFEYQNRLMELFTGEGNLLQPLGPENIRKRIFNLEEVPDSTNKFHYKKINEELGGYVQYRLSNVKGKVVNFYLSSSMLNGVEVFVDGEHISRHLDSYDHTINVFLADNDSHVITLALKNAEIGYYDELFYTHELKDLEEVKQQIDENSMQIVEFYPTQISAKLQNVSETQNLVLTIPYDEGWEVTVDGMKVNTFSIDHALLGVELTEGAENIVLQFVPKGMRLGRIISVASVFLLIWVAFVKKKRNGDGMIEK